MITTEQAVNAICGEAAGEPYRAKLAIACVMRNRGSLVGIYGIGASHISRETLKTLNECSRAWLESSTNDITHGCKHFGGKIDDKYFQSIGLKPVMTIHNTRIYK